MDTSVDPVSLPYIFTNLKAYRGNTVALFKEDQKFNPEYFTNPQVDGKVSGYFLSKDTKANYPYGDKPMMNMAFGAGYLSKLTSDYKYGKYFGLKFSIEASDKFTEMELRRANKPDMFTGTLSLNHFSDMKEKKIDAMENW